MERELFSGTYLYRMGRKAKITAVPIEQKEESIPSGEEEVKTDAQLMTEITNEVNAPEGLIVAQLVTEQEEEVPVIEDLVEVQVPKAKAKRAPRAKPSVVAEPVEQVVEPDATEPEVAEPEVVESKVDAKIACPDCGKQMSAKTLKYSHGPNCSSKKQKQGDEEGVKELIEKSVFEEVVEHEVQKRLHNTRACRAVRRAEMVEKLIQNAF